MKTLRRLAEVCLFASVLMSCASPRSKTEATIAPHVTADAGATAKGTPADPVNRQWRRECDRGNQASCERLAAPPSPDQLQRCEGGDAAACADAGLALATRRDDAAAAPLLERACRAGNAAGCGRFAVLLEQERGGLKADRARAIALHTQACWAREGDSFSCQKLGAAAANRETPDLGLAWKLHSRACDLGNAEGCVSVAYMIEKGEHVPADPERAHGLYRTACDRGAGNACYGLALQYEGGTVVARDPARALQLLALACERESAHGCQELGRRYWEGDGVAKDSAKALGLLRASCEFGMSRVCIKLGAAYGDGSDGVPQNEAAAMELYTLACEQGLSVACKLRKQYWPEDVPRAEQAKRDAARAVQVAAERKAACDGRDMMACGKLGVQMIEGDGIPTDKAGGQRLLQRACDGGDASACSFFGLFLDTGEMLPKDTVRARRYLKKACDLKDLVACGVLHGELR